MIQISYVEQEPVEGSVHLPYLIKSLSLVVFSELESPAE